MKRFLIIVTALALSVFAPTAAASSFDDRALSRATSPDPVSSLHPDDRAVSRATSPDLVNSLGPDDRAVSRATSPSLVNQSAHPDDRAVPRTWPVEAPTFVRVSDPGFDWTDFGVGAVGGFGIALALMGATLIAIRRTPREARLA